MTGRRRPTWSGSYSKVPHGFFEWPQVLEAGDRAALLLIRMSEFASRNETDGQLSAGQVATMGHWKRLAVDLPKLAEAGLIEPVSTPYDGHTHGVIGVIGGSYGPDNSPDGWQIVGWLDGHKTRAQIDEIREKRRSAGSRGGQAKAANASNLLDDELATCQAGCYDNDLPRDSDSDSLLPKSVSKLTRARPQPADDDGESNGHSDDAEPFPSLVRGER